MPSTSSSSVSMWSRACGFSAIRYQNQDMALAVVSWPASMNVRASSRTRWRGQIPPSALSNTLSRSAELVGSASRRSITELMARSRVSVISCISRNGGGR
ncbi:Uncharacterised protein [Mycobacterium tuberculosis]|nr:Uncharacterised protein [Mycobacterium tuberculosis]